MKLSVCSMAAAGVLAATLSVSAGTNTLAIPFYRGQAGAESAAWDTFTVATDNGIGNAPQFAGGANAHLIQLDPFAIVLGSGNIYNQGSISRFEIRDSASESVGLVTVSIRTVGNELDYSGVSLSYDLGAGVQNLSTSRLELERVSLGPPGAGGGAAVTSLYEWNLTGLGVKDFSVKFAAADVSVSLDSASIDTLSSAKTAVVPEPSTWALLGVGTALLVARGWRRR